MKRYILATEVRAIVRYSYGVDGENPYDAMKKFILKMEEQGFMEYNDYEIIQDEETIDIKIVKEIIKN